MTKFQREERYLVMKLKDIENALTEAEKDVLSNLSHKVHNHRNAKGKSWLTCVVVENTWPEYGVVWQMIEARVTDFEQGKGLSNAAYAAMYRQWRMI